MEKEKILQQLEEKLLPSVQNLERNQATEHDFFPALLWLLLEKSKNSESLLKETSKYSEEFKNIAAVIIESNKITQEKLNEIIENKASIIAQKIEEIKHTPLKIEKKFPIGFLVLSVFQLITLTILAVILMKQL